MDRPNGTGGAGFGGVGVNCPFSEPAYGGLGAGSRLSGMSRGSVAAVGGGIVSESNRPQAVVDDVATTLEPTKV